MTDSLPGSPRSFENAGSRPETDLDARIPDHLRALAIPAIRAAAATPGIVGLAAGGSVANGGTDRWSDLDLVVICTDDAYPSCLAHATDFAETIGPLLAIFPGDHVGEPRLRLCLFGPDPVHVDVKFVSLTDAGTRIEDGLILWEQDGAISTVYAMSTAIAPSVSPQWIEDRFWTWVHGGAVKAARGELFAACELLDFLRRIALGPLIAHTHGRPPSTVRRIETYAPEMVQPLAATIPAYDAVSCIAALRACVTLYTQLVSGIDDLEPNHPAREAVLRVLDRLETDIG